MSLTVDPKRCAAATSHATGITVRAHDGHGGVGTYDIWALDRESLLTWLRLHDTQTHRDPGYQFRERVILMVFGHQELP